jgi:hypothetical protein
LIAGLLPLHDVGSLNLRLTDLYEVARGLLKFFSRSNLADGASLIEFIEYTRGKGIHVYEDLALHINATAREEQNSQSETSSCHAPVTSETTKAIIETESPVVTVTLPYMTKTLEAMFKIMRDNSPYTGTGPKDWPAVSKIAYQIANDLGLPPEKDKKPARDASSFARAIKPDKV